MNRGQSLLWIFLLIGTLAMPTYSTTYYVWIFGNDSSNSGLNWGDAFATIQKAVAEAQEGDTILVGYDANTGTEYSVNSATIVNKALVISSARFGTDIFYKNAVPDSAKCLLSAEFNNRLFSITAKTEIRGLGLKKGNATVGSAYLYGYGGAIVINGSNASGTLIHQCWFDSNYAAWQNSDGYGGAIAIEDIDNGLTIRQNRFTNNVAATGADGSGYGGAIYSSSVTNLRIENNIFQQNTGAKQFEGYGGAVYLEYTDSLTILTGNRFISNIATYGPEGYGGALYIEENGLIENNLFEQNTASRHATTNLKYFGLGGAIYASDGTAHLQIRNNTIQNNVASADSVSGHGGGIYLWTCSNSLVENNTIKENIGTRSNSTGTGGGIEAAGETYVIIRNNHIEGNIAGQDFGEGGGIFMDGGLVEHNQIRDNIAATNYDGAGRGGGIYASGPTIIYKNTIENNYACTGEDGTGWGGGLACWTFDDGSQVLWNTFSGNVGTNGYQGKGGALFLSDTTQVFYNIFKSNIAAKKTADIAIGDGIYIYYNAGSQLRIYHNVFFRHPNVIYSDYLNFATLDNFNVVNNIFYNTPAERPIEMIYSEKDMDIYNNCFYGYALNTSQSPLKYNVNVFSKNEVDADPRIDTTTFAPQFDSPCIDAGLGDYALDKVENYALGWRRDIGVHEYTGSHVRQYLSGKMIGDMIYFGGQVRVKMLLTSATIQDGAYMDITVYPGQSHSSAANSVTRYYTIRSSGLSNTTVNLWLSYKDSELNGQKESQLILLRRFNNRWEGPYFTTRDTSANWVQANNVAPEGEWILTTDSSLVPIAQNTTSLPAAFRLYGNYPNPFNPVTTIVFDLPRREHVTIAIYNALGQKVRTLLDQTFAAGHHQILWNGRNDARAMLPSGLYFLHFTAGPYSQIHKMLMLK